MTRLATVSISIVVVLIAWSLLGSAISAADGDLGYPPTASTGQESQPGCDSALPEQSLIFAAMPTSGSAVSSGFTVTGCSRTFESTVKWELLDSDGSTLANGFAMGGGVDGPAAFALQVDFTVSEQQIGHLRVFEVDASDGEGRPPPEDIVPLVLEPGGGAGQSGCDSALPDQSLVFAAMPTSGSAASSGFSVAGCSRTFESTVNWELLDRDGSTLASGFTMGGGVDGPAAFDFQVDFTVSERQVGHLRIFEVDASDGEGRPPPVDIVPLVLEPGGGDAAGFTGMLPGEGFGLVTFSGSMAELEGALIALDCVAPVFSTSEGDFIGFFPTSAVQLVNEAFLALFPAGLPPGTPLLGGNCESP